MSEAATCDVSVVLCTYNRADRLELALDALLEQEGSVAYEVIVVDNNSTDRTAEVVRQAAIRAPSHIRYIQERQQGKSFALNRGIGEARSAIIALTDDDVRVAPDWVQAITATLESRPDIDYVGGRVLPYWLAPPPAWLTMAHWSPLALQDYGPECQVVGPERAVCLVGCNMAYRLRVFDRVGLFTPALGRLKDGIGSVEDHDLQLRAWRCGMRGLYTPALMATADVTPERMVKSYHRRWHRGHGRYCARMRLREYVPADLEGLREPRDAVRLFGTPAFVYAELFRTAWRWLHAVVRRKDPFFYANQFRHVWNYVSTGYDEFSSRNAQSTVKEFVAFARAYVRKRLRLRAADA